MKSSKLEAIVELACEQFKAFTKEDAEKIGEAMAVCLEEAQLQEVKPKFRLNCTITLDLEKNFQENSVSYGMRRKLSNTVQIPDPNQLRLPE